MTRKQNLNYLDFISGSMSHLLLTHHSYRIILCILNKAHCCKLSGILYNVIFIGKPVPYCMSKRKEKKKKTCSLTLKMGQFENTVILRRS